MKLAIVSRPFAFHGGVQTATAGLVEALWRHGHEVHLYTPGGQPPVPGATLHGLPVPRGPSVARVLWLVVAASRALRAAEYDVVQSHERTLRQDIYRAGEGCHRAYLAARPSRGRHVYHAVMLVLERRVFQATPRIVAIARRGQEEVERLYRLPAGRVRVIYNGVDLARFHPDNRARYRGALLAEAAAPPDAFVVLFVGSGFERKGLDTLIDALARLEHRGWRLLVVGKGDADAYRARAGRRGIAERIVWAGPRADIERWYGAADLVALPSRYEPFGNAHLEALASGVPVVSSTAAGGAELIEDGRNGAVVAPDDPGGLAAAIDRLAALPARSLGEAARRSAEPFTYAAQVGAFERLYAQIPLVRGEFR
jgi:UDP-glucose:(heptosyl)LPS alpha-1,3-glucosyltransferase